MALTQHMVDVIRGPRALWLAGLGSFSLLAAALAFEHIGGLAPCKLCLTQRVPHYGIVALAMIGIITPQANRLWRLMAAALALMTASVGLQHVGVEQGWWQGPQGCTAQMAGGDLASLTDSLLATPVVRCDEIAWQLLGISMAGWNMIASLIIASLLVYSVLAGPKAA